MTRATLAASVIICTYQRLGLLKRALEGCLQQVVEDGRIFEVLVVDNACASSVEHVVKRLNRQDGRCEMRYIAEPEVGHSHARNVGLRHARAEIIVYLDDDAVPASPGWLNAYLSCFEDNRVGAVGGPVVPEFAHARPSWLSRHLEAKYSILEFSGNGPSEAYRRSLPFPSRMLPMGANVAFRRRALVHGFDVHTGRVGESLRSRDELSTFHALERAGYEIWLAEAAAVSHHVAAGRLTKNWILARSDAEGRSRVADRLARGQSRAVAVGASVCHAVGTALLGASLLLTFVPGAALAARCRWREALAELRSATVLLMTTMFFRGLWQSRWWVGRRRHRHAPSARHDHRQRFGRQRPSCTHSERPLLRGRPRLDDEGPERQG